ncbi:hypothetical protein FA13DRAFT_258570 [Coprinellus micaceus]|uniref:F-box domain-containing protein n=1 Tax=Coprinellus micaceus TaxID=71717 RepID=A0A4Y7TG53_COPMI|nr:hypothetical protein FA13DRAFT_258570 [Coprinellus micaceus]
MQSMQIATNWVPGALAPRLEDFMWIAPRSLEDVFGEDVVTHFPVCMALFLGPTVTSTRIQMDLHNHLYQSVLEASSDQLHPRLRKLHIEIHDLLDEDLPENEILPFIHDHVTCANSPSLAELRVSGMYVAPCLTSTTIRHLGTLPRLAVLDLDDFEDLPFLCLPAGADIGGAFPSLQNVKLSSTSLSGITHFLEHFPPLAG